MTNKETIQYIKEYGNNKGYVIEDDNDVWEILRDATSVHEQVVEDRRWWRVFDIVVQLDGIYIIYEWATTKGDMSAQERGWEPDLKTINQVYKHTKMVETITYDSTMEIL